MATATTNQTAAPAITGSIDPAALVVTAPAADDVTILTRDNGALIDLRAVLNEPITFTRIDGDLTMVFENGGTVVIGGFFSGSGAEPAVLVADEGTTTLSLDQFSSIAGVEGTEGIQTAAGAPVTLGDQVNQPDGSGQSFEDPGLAGLGDGLGILDLLGPGDLLSNEILLPEELLPGLDTDAEDTDFLASLDDGTEEPISEDPLDEDPVDEDPIDEDPGDEEPVVEPVGDLYLWLDQPNHSGWIDTHFRDIIEFENLNIQINGEPVGFSVDASLTDGVNQTPGADEGDYALDGADERQLFLNLGELTDLPESGEIRVDFHFSNFDKRSADPEQDSEGGLETLPGNVGQGYRFGVQVGTDEDDEARETVVDHTDNGIAFINNEGSTPHDDEDSPRTIKFDYEITEDGDIEITNVLTIFRGGLVLDLDDDGLEMNNSVQFDMDLDGSTEEIGWMGAGDGLLVMDLNSDGIINDASEVVGQHFQGGSQDTRDIARFFSGAHEALDALDNNRDGLIDTHDTAYHDLRVWVDENGDGVTDTGELKTLADLGITSIDIDSLYEDQTSNYDESWEDVNDNIIDREGSFTRDDGSTGSIYDTRFWESEPLPGSTDTVTTGASDVLSSLADADLFSDILQTTALDMGDILKNAFPTPVTDPDSDDQASLPDADMLFDMQSMGETINMVVDVPVDDAAFTGQPA